jgi:hypothetical protein
MVFVVVSMYRGTESRRLPMSYQLPPVSTQLFLGDTRWAIATKLPPAVLETTRYQISDYLQAAAARVVAGNDGMSVLLAFGGSLGEGDALAIDIARLHGVPVYLLDFSEEYPSVRELTRSQCRAKGCHPAHFLASYGVIAPGHEPRPAEPLPNSAGRSAPTSHDYAATAGALRGTAGELMLSMAGVELPGGYVLVARQVNALGKKIDFGLQDARGRKARLEVKAWSQKVWARELGNGRQVDPESALGRMLGQLRAAQATGKPVYLAVLDVIGKHLVDLRRLLCSHKLDGVTVLTFPEDKLESIFHKLREELAIPAGVTPELADLLVEAQR